MDYETLEILTTATLEAQGEAETDDAIPISSSSSFEYVEGSFDSPYIITSSMC